MLPDRALPVVFKTIALTTRQAKCTETTRRQLCEDGMT